MWLTSTPVRLPKWLLGPKGALEIECLVSQNKQISFSDKASPTGLTATGNEPLAWAATSTKMQKMTKISTNASPQNPIA